MLTIEEPLKTNYIPHRAAPRQGQKPSTLHPSSKAVEIKRRKQIYLQTQRKKRRTSQKFIRTK